MEIQAESGLRVLAINNLGKFLLNHDRNIKYVALTTLLRTVQSGDNGSEAVQRHRDTIVDCLREPDITIRRRALALVIALINRSNVRGLVQELLSFLRVADTEFKAYTVTELLMAADRFSPSPQWHVETCLEILRVAGAYMQEEGVAEVVHILASTEALHRHTVQQLYLALLKVRRGKRDEQAGETGKAAGQPRANTSSGRGVFSVRNCVQAVVLIGWRRMSV